MAGASLCDLQRIIPPGSFCRHITRVADFCEEVTVALEDLGVDSSTFSKAGCLISRGLPFLKRGLWKAGPACFSEEEEEKRWTESETVAL
jgi:hypothetical protein